MNVLLITKVYQVYNSTSCIIRRLQTLFWTFFMQVTDFKGHVIIDLFYGQLQPDQ